MRVGIIGCGNIAQVHAWSLQSLGQTEQIELAAFSDCRVEKAESMSAKYTDGKAGVYRDYVDMLEQADLDVVHICTPHYLHVPIAMEALKRDISVFMEKPPAVSTEEFDEMVQLASSSKAVAGFCFQNRYNATTAELDRVVAQNMLGKVIGVRGFVTWRRDEDYYSDDWHGSLEKECGGVLINQSIHTLDLMLRYLGTPKTVAASMQNHHLAGITEVEDTLEAWLQFEDGKRASFYATTAYATDAPVVLEVSFEKGRVMVIDKTVQIYENGKQPEIIYCDINRPGVGKDYWGAGHLACIEDFYRCKREGIAYKNDLAGVANTLYTTMRIYEEARK